jgi:hypothetical protein
MSLRHNNGSTHFRVQMNGAAAGRLKAIYRRARAANREDAVAVAARQIDHRLRTDARTFGEPIKSYAAAEIEFRQAAVAPLVVYYGVHRTQPEVFVQDFREMQGGEEP